MDNYLAYRLSWVNEHIDNLPLLERIPEDADIVGYFAEQFHVPFRVIEDRAVEPQAKPATPKKKGTPVSPPAKAKTWSGTKNAVLEVVAFQVVRNLFHYLNVNKSYLTWIYQMIITHLDNL